MRRTLKYHITEAEQNLPVKQFLKTKGYSARSMTQLKKRPESVLINSQSVYLTHRLSLGDELTIQISEDASSEKILPVKLPLDIVYEDDDLLIIDKPAGTPIHPSMNNYDNSVANALAWYFKEQDTPFVFRCINRLDRDTSGLTIVAKHMVSAGILSEMVASKGTGGIQREYLAIVRGSVTPPSGVITAPLSRKSGSVIERIVDFERGESAVTHYRVIREANGHSLLSLRLETGRTHQIRIHLKYLGYPLIGDYLYNPDTEYIDRQALHSHRLSFPHPITGAPLEFISPLPPDMQKVLTMAKQIVNQPGSYSSKCSNSQA